MHRYWREQPPRGIFRGAELTRLITGIVLLVVLYILIIEARDVNAWRWLAPESLAISQERTPKAPKGLSPATGPTDEDPDRADAAREEFQAITDGTLTLGPEEMEPYDRLVSWVKNQSFARLSQRARSDLLFTNFHDEPDKYRGQPATLELNVRRILDAGKNRDGVHLYEVWGFTTESRDRLYVAIVADLPDGMPIGPSVYEKAKFAGYFLKLQGYHAVGAGPGAVPDRSPLLIGRLQWTPPPVVKSPISGRQEWFWGLGLLAVIALAIGFRWIYQKSSRSKSALHIKIPEPASGEVIPIEKWLDQSDFNEGSDSGSGLAENDSS